MDFCSFKSWLGVAEDTEVKRSTGHAASPIAEDEEA